MAYTRLPKSTPQSLKFEKKPVSDFAKARTHEKKAEKVRKDDEGKPHVEYHERWKALEFAVADIKEVATKELNFKLAKDPKGHELLGHLVASLSKPRLDLIFKDERIGKLNLLLAKRTPAKLIDQNEKLLEVGIRHKDYISAKRDLKFSVGLQSYKASQALAVMLSIVRWASEPKARKKVSLVKDEDVLEVANGILRDITTHVVEEMQLKNAQFFEVGDRKTREGGGILPSGRPIVPGQKV